MGVLRHLENWHNMACMDIATYRLNWPRGWFSQNRGPAAFKEYWWLMDHMVTSIESYWHLVTSTVWLTYSSLVLWPCGPSAPPFLWGCRSSLSPGKYTVQASKDTLAAHTVSTKSSWVFLARKISVWADMLSLGDRKGFEKSRLVEVPGGQHSINLGTGGKWPNQDAHLSSLWMWIGKEWWGLLSRMACSSATILARSADSSETSWREGTGGRRQETGDRRQETGILKRGITING